MNKMKILIKYILLLHGLIMVGFSLLSQQGNNWYFGFNAGVTFNTNPPTALTNSAMYTNEGCASISDDYGNLLFYTDGTTIYNKKHQVMMNGDGLLGDFSATQSALLVQQPGNDSLYYVFTSPAGETGFRGGYNYNIININKNGGDGEVILKNQFIFGVATEKITAGRAANGKDVWIMVKEFNSRKFLAYKLDCGGLDLNPVISILGDSIFNSAGYMKISGDGKYLAVAIAGNIEPYINIYQFDNSTGLLSSPIRIPIAYATYGLEFSPDSKLLYATSYPDFKGIYQFSIATYDSAAIANSKTFLNIGNYVTALQTGPDGKIYVARLLSKVLSVIDYPNVQGPGCNYRDSAIILTKECRSGLPNFLANQLVNQNTTIDYSVNPDCSTVSFTGATSMQGPVNWLWDYGDGSTSSNQNPVHNFASGNNQFNIKLTVTPVTGCGRSYTTKILNLVRPLLTAKFGILNTCGNNSVLFEDISVITAGAITSWLWDFGDGSTSNVQNPVHAFVNTGNHSIKLTIGYSQGCVVADDTTRTFTIESKPAAGFASTKGCVNKDVSFSDLTSISTGTIAKWLWVFGDGTMSSAQSPVHNYNTPGAYNIQQIVVSNTGCTDTVLKQITVDDKPVADFSTGNTCVNAPVLFADKSTSKVGTISNWSWTMGDGSIDYNANPAHLYIGYGEYFITLVVSTAQGCLSETLKRSIKVESKPVADFTVLPGCVNANLVIENKSDINFGSISQYYWDWGNGMYSQEKQPSFAYPSYGNFTIKTAVKSQSGCVSDTVLKTITIQTIPKPDFSFSSTCVGKPVRFTNLSTNESGTIANWLWKFGNNEGGSTVFAPIYNYTKFGNYPISLSASTSNGCNAQVSKNISIIQVDVSTGRDTIIAENQPLQLHATGATDYTWSPSQYLDNPKSNHPVSLLPKSFTYYLSGVTAEGCTGYDTINIKVYKGPEVYVPTAFTPNADRKNDIFKPVFVGIKDLLYFSVYNRWGQLLYTTKEIGQGWNGTIKGVIQPSGEFVWMLKATDYNGQLIEKKGVAFLIR